MLRVELPLKPYLWDTKLVPKTLDPALYFGLLSSAGVLVVQVPGLQMDVLLYIDRAELSVLHCLPEKFFFSLSSPSTEAAIFLRNNLDLPLVESANKSL